MSFNGKMKTTDLNKSMKTLPILNFLSNIFNRCRIDGLFVDFVGVKITFNLIFFIEFFFMKVIKERITNSRKKKTLEHPTLCNANLKIYHPCINVIYYTRIHIFVIIV